MLDKKFSFSFKFKSPDQGRFRIRLLVSVSHWTARLLTAADGQTWSPPAESVRSVSCRRAALLPHPPVKHTSTRPAVRRTHHTLAGCRVPGEEVLGMSNVRCASVINPESLLSRKGDNETRSSLLHAMHPTLRYASPSPELYICI